MMINELNHVFWNAKQFSQEVLGAWAAGDIGIGIGSLSVILFLLAVFDDDRDEEAQKKILRNLESMSVLEIVGTSLFGLVVVAGLLYVAFLYM